MKTRFGRLGNRGAALAILALVMASCDLANNDGGPGSGPGLSGSLPADPLAGAVLQNIRATVGETVEPNSSAQFVDISADGRFICFTSFSNNLVPTDTNNQQDVFILDRDFDGGTPNAVFDEPGTMLVTRVSLTDSDVQGTGGTCNNCSISQDGRFVAFSSNMNNLTADDTNGTIRDIFVRDRGANFNATYVDGDGSTILVSRATGAAGTVGNSTSDQPSISGDGNRVVYQSSANNLVPGDTNGTSDIFLRDIAGQSTLRLSTEVPPAFPGPDGLFDGDNASGFSSQPAISQDGNIVVFLSTAADIVNFDFNARQDVFARNISAGALYGMAPGACEIVSVSDTEVQHNNGVIYASPSADGRFVGFDCSTTNFHPLDGDFFFDVYRRDLATDSTLLVSVSDGGFKGNSDSAFPVTSGSGDTIFFTSAANNLDPAATSFFFQAYFRDITAGDTELASVNSSGVAGNSDSAVFNSNGNSMSADGVTGVYPSFANNLIQGDVNFTVDIYARDRSQPLTFRASAPPGSEPLTACTGNVIANNAPVVAFVSSASNLIPGVTDGLGQVDVFLRDTIDQSTRLVSRNTGGGFPNGASGNPSISSDGRFIAFDSTAPDLTTDPNNGFRDIFLRDMASGEMFLISVDTDGNATAADSANPSISASGRFVAFESADSGLDNVVTDTNGTRDIFVRDLVTGTTTRVSLHSDQATESDADCFNPAISGDGRFVAFESAATTLHAAATSGNTNIYLHDTQTHTTTLVSSIPGGASDGDGNSGAASISGDGRLVAYQSLSTNLVAGEVGAFSDIFLFDRTTGANSRVSTSSGGTAGDNHSTRAAISVDGLFLAFASSATNLVTPATTGEQIFRKDLQTGTTILISVNESGTPGNAASTAPTITSNGRWVAFDTQSVNLVQGDTSSVVDVIIRGPLP